MTDRQRRRKKIHPHFIPKIIKNPKIDLKTPEFVKKTSKFLVLPRRLLQQRVPVVQTPTFRVELDEDGQGGVGRHRTGRDLKTRLKIDDKNFLEWFWFFFLTVVFDDFLMNFIFLEILIFLEIKISKNLI